MMQELYGVPTQRWYITSLTPFGRSSYNSWRELALNSCTDDRGSEGVPTLNFHDYYNSDETFRLEMRTGSLARCLPPSQKLGFQNRKLGHCAPFFPALQPGVPRNRVIIPSLSLICFASRNAAISSSSLIVREVR